MASGPDFAARLVPYVPLLALEWLEGSPEVVHRRVEGTVLFVDVSGFTALTERLAARGKVGAEEITDVIESAFTELLGVAAAYGADLLKWGGDASVLFFAEPCSAERACRAAALMSRTMVRVGRLRTSAGRVNLGVSIGAHSGGFDFYLLGSRHRELVVTGPAATVTARMEGIAEAGEVIVSPDTARRLPPGVLGPPKRGGVVLRDAPEADELPLRSAPALSHAVAVSLLPAETRDHLLGGGEQAEHRQATIAFIEFSGVDDLSLRDGPRAVADVLEPLVESVTESAARRGVSFHGTDIGPDGGKLIVLGGVPVLRGNDAERVLSCVKDIVADRRADSPLRLRAGVNGGRVFVSSHAVGLGSRRIFAIAGDSVNLAARVMGQALPGQVLATESVLIRAGHVFETEGLPPFEVKGKAEPVVASVVGTPRDSALHDVGKEVPFVGREAELRELLSLADRAAGGAGAVVEIIGSPGIGKSRLATEAIERWALDTLRVACEEYGSATPYLPFRRVFRRLLGMAEDAPHDLVVAELRRAVSGRLGDLEPFLPLLAGLIGASLPPTPEVEALEPRFRRSRLELCALQLLRLFVSRPSALVIEDAHAIDAASASLLGRVALEAAELPLLVVLTGAPRARELLPEHSRSVVIDLAPLDPQSSTLLVAAATEAELAPAQVDAIVTRSEGNPLFLRELARTAGDVADAEGLPESLEPLLAAEIDLLAPLDRQVLRAASVLGGHFDPELLPDLLEGTGIVAAATQALDPVAKLKLKVEEAVWARLSAFVLPTAHGRRFAHALMRDAAYEGLSFKRRRELHARAARAIEARASTPEEGADLLSLHWLEAEEYEQAWNYSRIAGERARALWANADAVTCFTRALEAARHLSRLDPGEVSSVAEALGDACELSARYEAARDAYARSRRLAASAVDRARLLRKTGVLYERQGRYRQALSCHTRGRRLLVADDEAARRELCELDLASAGLYSRQGRYRACRQFATRAATEAVRAGHRSGLAHALYLQHLLSVYLGGPDDELGYRALGIFEELSDLLGQGNALNNLGIGAYFRGEWERALELYERSRDARARAGDVVGAATEENNIAEILSDRGDTDAARPLLEAARSTWQAAGYRVGTALATANLGRLEARVGDTARGRRLLEEALAEFREIRSHVMCVETEVRLAETTLLEGNFSAAVTMSRELLETLSGRAGVEQVEVSTLRVLATASALIQACRNLGSTDRRDTGEPGGECAAALPGEYAAVLPGAPADAPASNEARLFEQAIGNATAIGASYELALCLYARAISCSPASPARPAGAVPASGAAIADLRHAEEIFDRLGVRQAVITWSTAPTGAPIIARGPSSRAIVAGHARRP